MYDIDSFAYFEALELASAFSEVRTFINERVRDEVKMIAIEEIAKQRTRLNVVRSALAQLVRRHDDEVLRLNDALACVDDAESQIGDYFIDCATVLAFDIAQMLTRDYDDRKTRNVVACSIVEEFVYTTDSVSEVFAEQDYDIDSLHTLYRARVENVESMFQTTS